MMFMERPFSWYGEGPNALLTHFENLNLSSIGFSNIWWVASWAKSPLVNCETFNGKRHTLSIHSLSQFGWSLLTDTRESFSFLFIPSYLMKKWKSRKSSQTFVKRCLLRKYPFTTIILETAERCSCIIWVTLFGHKLLSIQPGGRSDNCNEGRCIK